MSRPSKPFKPSASTNSNFGSGVGSLARVTFVYGTRPGLPLATGATATALLTEFRGAVNPDAFGKIIRPGTTVEPVSVDGASGYWIVGEPHDLLYRVPGADLWDPVRLAGNVLSAALSGRLESDELHGRLRPFGVGESAALLLYEVDDPEAAEGSLETALAAAGSGGLVAATSSASRPLLCAVVDGDGADPVETARATTPSLWASSSRCMTIFIPVPTMVLVSII